MPDKDEIDLIEVKRNKWMAPEEAEKDGYNLWLVGTKPKKGEPFWGPEGLWPILTLVIVSFFGWIVTALVHHGVGVLIPPLSGH